MDRQIVYLGQQPLETDLLNTNKFAMMGLAKLAEALLGNSTGVIGLSCTPTAPASLQVQIAPGQIYAMAQADSTAFSSLPADTHTVLKQGLSLDTTFLNCAAPTVIGQSINYLIQVGFQEQDQNALVLNYYNSADPAQAFAGPNGGGLAQATVRQDRCLVQLKAGAAAATGTQTTPLPDAGFVGLYVVTVAYGQITITASSIVSVKTAQYIKPVATQVKKWARFYRNLPR